MAIARAKRDTSLVQFAPRVWALQVHVGGVIACSQCQCLRPLFNLENSARTPCVASSLGSLSQERCCAERQRSREGEIERTLEAGEAERAAAGARCGRHARGERRARTETWRHRDQDLTVGGRGPAPDSSTASSASSELCACASCGCDSSRCDRGVRAISNNRYILISDAGDADGAL